MKIGNNRFVNFALILVLLVSSLAACGNATDATDSIPPSQEVNQSTPISKASGVPPAPIQSAQAGTWLIMLYQNGDDEVLEEDTVIDLNEAEIGRFN